jgi:hypothetical protein
MTVGVLVGVDVAEDGDKSLLLLLVVVVVVVLDEEFVFVAVFIAKSLCSPFVFKDNSLPFVLLLSLFFSKWFSLLSTKGSSDLLFGFLSFKSSAPSAAVLARGGGEGGSGAAVVVVFEFLDSFLDVVVVVVFSLVLFVCLELFLLVTVPRVLTLSSVSLILLLFLGRVVVFPLLHPRLMSQTSLFR